MKACDLCQCYVILTYLKLSDFEISRATSIPASLWKRNKLQVCDILQRLKSLYTLCTTSSCSRKTELEVILRYLQLVPVSLRQNPTKPISNKLACRVFQGHPTTICGNYLFEKDDLRSRIFETFVVNFLASPASPRIFEPPPKWSPRIFGSLFSSFSG